MSSAREEGFINTPHHGAICQLSSTGKNSKSNQNSQNRNASQRQGWFMDQLLGGGKAASILRVNTKRGDACRPVGCGLYLQGFGVKKTRYSIEIQTVHYVHTARRSRRTYRGTCSATEGGLVMLQPVALGDQVTRNTCRLSPTQRRVANHSCE